MPYKAWIEEIAFYSVNNKEHEYYSRYYAEAWISCDSGKYDRNASYKHSQDWYKARQECDSSKSEKIREYIAFSSERCLTIDDTDYHEA